MLGSIEALMIEGRAAGRSPASGAAPGQAISPARPGPPPRFQLWGRLGDCSMGNQSSLKGGAWTWAGIPLLSLASR